MSRSDVNAPDVMALEASLRSLGKAAAAAQSRTQADHVEPWLVAAWLDKELPEDQSALLEGHLADCTDCRELALDAAAALAAEVNGADVLKLDSPAQGPREHKLVPTWQSSDAGRWLLAAAVLLSVTWGAVRLANVDPRLRSSGVDTTRALVGDRQILNLATGIFDGVWPDSSILEELPPPKAFSASRNANPKGGPLPLEPRWEASLDRRPTFRWLLPATDADEEPRFEVVLVNNQDQLVVHFEVAATSGGGIWATELPADVTLAAGQAYAWKVAHIDASGWPRASDYIPFHVLTGDDAVELRVALKRESAPLLRAAHFVRFGAFSPARRELQLVENSGIVSQQWLEPLRQRQHLGPGTDPEDDGAGRP